MLLAEDPQSSWLEIDMVFLLQLLYIILFATWREGYHGGNDFDRRRVNLIDVDKEILREINNHNKLDSNFNCKCN